MTPNKFVENIKSEIDFIVKQYSKGTQGQTELGTRLDSLELNNDQRQEVLALLKLAAQESVYTVICGLDGGASLGEDQETFQIYDESENNISGELGVLFYEKVML